MTFAATTFYLSVAATAVSTYSAYTQAKTNKAIAENNAEVADINAESAKRQGELDAQKVRRQGKQLEGTQRASYAARGLDLGEGTPSDVLEQTDFFTQSDEVTARNNAAKNAWAIKRGGVSERLKADGINPGMTLLGDSLGVASKWYGYSAANKPPGG